MHGSPLPRAAVQQDGGTSPRVSFLWLEITGKCQLECLHCYADSGPAGTHGSMSVEDWKRTIDQGAALGAGAVQFIGGEPTLHPDLAELIAYALDAGLGVEVYSNLVHVTPAMWAAFGRPGVRLACSYYSDRAAQHTAVTRRAGSHARTRANIVEALRRSIPLRVGVIGLGDAQRTDDAVAELTALGVPDVGTDRLRHLGRGASGHGSAMSELCGGCADDVLAIGPHGDVWPCPVSRWLPVGNILASPLAEVLAGRAVTDTRAAIGAATRRHAPKCTPETSCAPQGCGPSGACTPDMRCRPN